MTFDGFDSSEVDGREGGWRLKRGGFEWSEGWFEVVGGRRREELGSSVKIEDGGEEFGLVEESIDDRLPEMDLRCCCDSLAEVVVPDETLLLG